MDRYRDTPARQVAKHVIPCAAGLGMAYGTMAPMPAAADPDLGFTYRSRKGGVVEVLHHGRLASTLRGTDALDFLAEVEAGSGADAQQLMARVTGNYKRGNERTASVHPRNRR